MLLDLIHRMNPLNKGWLARKEQELDAVLASKEEQVNELDKSIIERKNRITETATRLEETARQALADFNEFEGRT